MTKTKLALIAGAAIFSSTVKAQQVTVSSSEPQMFQFRMLSSEGFGPGRIVTGMPFSAEETNTTTQVLLDGTRIVNSSSSKVFRDQQGRTRTENTLANIGGVTATQPKVSVMINDPVSGSNFMLNPEDRTVIKMGVLPTFTNEKDGNALHITKLVDEATARVHGEPGNTATYAFASKTFAETKSKMEELGVQTMEGVQVKGTRSTMIIPAGAMGNDREISVVTERWYSPDLQMNIMTKRVDPRMGETVFQVTNLNRSNPDSSLFSAPADYQVKDMPKGLMINRATTIQK